LTGISETTGFFSQKVKRKCTFVRIENASTTELQVNTMMKQLITAFPNNLNEAIAIAEKAPFNKPSREIRQVVVCGMGGSGIGARIVSEWLRDSLGVPFTVVQDYSLPASVDSSSLVIASSYSGNTEETLIAFDAAIQRGALLAAVCSGGKLADLCRTKSIDCIIVPGGNPPRTALAFSLVQLMHILSQYGLIHSSELDTFRASATLIQGNLDAIHAQAKDLAQFLQHRIPIFYTTSRMESIAIRARQQFNENAKVLCWHHVVPEMNHNELVGWTGGTSEYAPVLLKSKDIHPRNEFRFKLSKVVMEEKCGTTFTLQAKGEHAISEALYLIHVIDWASYYLAELKNEDPIAIPVIDHLKGELDKF
jgi:glucose/mannose-6-phosphate isomerase